jgi:thiazole synthase
MSIVQTSLPPLPGSQNESLRLGRHTLHSRLIVGTGRYETLEIMQQSLDLSGSDCITVAVRRERLYDGSGKNILDYLDLKRYTLLPNSAGC